jgi:uncharacterized protein
VKFKSYIITGLFIPYFLVAGCKTKNESPKEVITTVSEEAGNTRPELNVSIYEAALNGQLPVVTEHLKRGVDVNLKDDDNRTTLMYASFNGHTEIIKKLIEKGAQVNVSDTFGRTALMMASSGPYPAAVKILLDNYADPNITDKDEHFTALMFAASEGQLDVVKLLIANKADPSLKDIDGDNAFTFATNNGHKEVADLLASL